MAGLTLILGAAASGKTAALLDRAAEHYRSDPFQATLVLVPTVRHGDQFRQRLVARIGVAFGLDVSTIGVFAQRHVDRASIASREVADELLARTARAQVAAGAAAYFAPIADTPGFLSLIGTAVGDLEQEGVDAAAFGVAAAATHDPRLRALADICRAYQAALAGRGWRDPRAAAAAAARHLGAVADVPSLVLVDGFQFFRHGELDLLEALAARADVVVALATDAGERAHHSAVALGVRVPDAARRDLADRAPTSRATTGSVSTSEAELREIVREIKQRLADEPALRPSDFAVTYRQVAPHLPLARQIFAEYDLPFDPAAGERLRERPFGSWLIRLLRLGLHGWRVGDLVEVLTSDFSNLRRWGLAQSDLELVARQARDRRLWSSLTSLHRLAAGLQETAGDADGSADREQRRARAGRGLAAVLTDLAPLLEREEADTPAAFAQTLDAALFGATPLVRADLDLGADLDVEIGAVRRALRSFGTINEALGSDPVAFDVFVGTLEARMDVPAVVLREAGGVLFAPMHTLHGLRFAHLSAGGLVEGEFPAPRRARPLLDARAREALAAAGFALPPEARAAEDELWHSVRTRADQSLSAWHSRLDDRGRPRAPSSYLDTLDAASTDHPDVVAPEDAASTRELASALTVRWPAGEQRRPPLLAAWSAVRDGVRIEQRRRSFHGAGAYEGRLPAASLPRLTDPETIWSATRFESYRTCPFQFFSHYGLRLREVDQELDAADAATRGTVIHAILEAVLQPLADAGQRLGPESIEQAVERLHAVGPDIWDQAPEHYGFGRAALWRLEGTPTLAQVDGLLRREAAMSAPLGVTAIADTEMELSADLGDGVAPLRVAATIDRVDRGEGFVQIVDYKTGKAITRAEVEDGRRLQLQIYAQLAAEHFSADRAVARYAYLDPSHRIWKIDTVEAADAALLTQARTAVQAVRASVEAGEFPVAPTVPVCPSYCDFQHICRVNQFSRWKQWS